MQRVVGNAPTATELLKSTADVDGTVTNLDMAASVDLPDYEGDITVVIAIKDATNTASSLTVTPRKGAVATPDGTWANGDADAQVVTGTPVGGALSLTCSFAREGFGDKRYGSVRISGTIGANAEFSVTALGSKKR